MKGNMISRRLIRVARATALALVAMAVPTAAFAAGDNQVHVIQKNQNDNTNTFELSAVFIAQMNSRFSSGMGAGLTAAYQPVHYFGIEASYFELFSSAETGASDELANVIGVAASGADRSAVQRFTGLSLRFVPIYGKFSFFGSNTAFLDVFVTLGGAAINTKEGDLLSRGPEGDLQTFVNSDWRPAGTIGGGFRLFPIRWLVVKFEVRNLMYATSGAHALDQDNNPGTGDDPDEVSARKLRQTAFRNNVYGLLGLGFVF